MITAEEAAVRTEERVQEMIAGQMGGIEKEILMAIDMGCTYCVIHHQLSQEMRSHLAVLGYSLHDCHGFGQEACWQVRWDGK